MSTSIHRHLATRRRARGRRAGWVRGFQNSVDAHGSSFGEDQTSKLSIKVTSFTVPFHQKRRPCLALDAAEPRQQRTLGCGLETPLTMPYVHYRRITGKDYKSRESKGRARHTTGDTTPRGRTNQKVRGKAHTNQRGGDWQAHP